MTNRIVTGLLVLATAASAQHRVDPRNTYHRVIAVVPLVGTGTANDPIRPKYAPSEPITSTPSPTDIIGFTQVPTDDGKSAIVEFVARSRTAFQAILADTTITTFEKGTENASAIEATLQKLKKGFSLVQFEAVMP
jgi:hypothetical protein